jgi:hypothetical protein
VTAIVGARRCASGLEVSGDLFRDPVECRLKSRFAFVSAPFTPTRYRAQTHWYRSLVRVVDLDIGASKWENLRAVSEYFD